MYGTIWIRPSAERERPYHLISKDALDIQDMMDAEETPAHMTAYNYQHREMPGLLAQLQTEGYDPYCFQSVLINGKSFLLQRAAMADVLQERAEFTASQMSSRKLTASP